MGVAWVGILPRQGVWGRSPLETIDFFGGGGGGGLRFWRFDGSYYPNLAN